jgi:hypothetical protein
MRNVQIYADLDGAVQALRKEKKLSEIADQWLQHHKELFWNEGHAGDNQLYIHFSRLNDHQVRAFVDFYGCHYWRSREEGQDLSCALRNALNHLELVHNQMEDEGGPLGHCPFDLPDTEKLPFHL